MDILDSRASGDANPTDTPALQPRPGSASTRLVYSLPYVVALVLGIALYSNTFLFWYYEWKAPGSFYAHAAFVPFFVGIMLWRSRESLNRLRWQPSWGGLGLIVPGLALLLLALHSDIPTVQSMSFILLLVGGSILFLGTPKTRLLMFPLLFVTMMMPLIPDQLINGIAFPIQLKSAQIATWMMNHIGLPSSQEGTQIHMEHYRMAVELPCSGFKTLLSLLTFSAAFAYLVEAPAWKRWTLFLTTAPLSLLINGLRIALIGVVGELFSTSSAQFFHDYSGVIVLILAFTFLFNFARILKCERFLGVPLTDEMEKRDREAVKAAKEAAGGAVVPKQEWWQEILMWRPTTGQLRRALPHAVALDVALLLSLVSYAALRSSVPTQKPPIATFQVPRTFTANGVTYVTKDNPLEETDTLPAAQLEMLSPLRVINRHYEGSDGSHIGLFMTAGTGRKVFHDPHNCALGSDAVILDQGPMPLVTPAETIHVQESYFKQTGRPEQAEMMFCYVVQGKVLQSTRQIRNALILQTFFGDGGQPSYFVRVCQDAPGTDEPQRQQMRNFISGLWQNIGPVLHGTTPGQPEAPPHASGERH